MAALAIPSLHTVGILHDAPTGPDVSLPRLKAHHPGVRIEDLPSGSLRLRFALWILNICQAYPPGKYFKVPSMPNVTAVNVLGDFDIAADRLAIIDGEGLSCQLLGFLR